MDRPLINRTFPPSTYKNFLQIDQSSQILKCVSSQSFASSAKQSYKIVNMEELGISIKYLINYSDQKVTKNIIQLKLVSQEILVSHPQHLTSQTASQYSVTSYCLPVAVVSVLFIDRQPTLTNHYHRPGTQPAT